jgi:hypothetical protein
MGNNTLNSLLIKELDHIYYTIFYSTLIYYFYLACLIFIILSCIRTGTTYLIIDNKTLNSLLIKVTDYQKGGNEGQGIVQPNMYIVKTVNIKQDNHETYIFVPNSQMVRILDSDLLLKRG